MARERPPGWILLIGAAHLLFTGFAAYLLIAGPETVGWSLQQSPDWLSRPGFLIASVEPGSAAARAGLQPGDLLLEDDLRRFLYHEEVGRQYRFEVSRAAEEEFIVTLVLRRPGFAFWLSRSGAGPITASLAALLNLLLAAVIAFGRPHEAVARLGALTLAGMSAFTLWYGLAKPQGIEAAIRNLPFVAGSFLLVAPTVASLTPSILITFVGVFPRSTISRGWLLFLFVITLAGLPVPIYGVWTPVYAPESAVNMPQLISPVYMIGAIAAMLGSAGLLVRNYFTLKGANERRRFRVLVTGFLITLAASIMQFAIAATQTSEFQFQQFSTLIPLPWVFAPFSAAAPICMAYAILRHRILDIRIMVRLGIQYAAARGLLLSTVPVLAILLVLDLLLHGQRPLIEILRERGWVYLVLGTLAFLLHVKQRSWLTALDRKFFRERYNAQQVLRAVVDEIRAARSFEKVAPHVASQIEVALHPEFAALLVRQPGELRYRVPAAQENAGPSIPAGSKLMALLRVLGKPLEISQSQTVWLTNQLPPQESEFLKQVRLEWLFPICVVEGQTEALLVMGPKKSEEPYSQEDQELLQGITSSLALLLEQSPSPEQVREEFEECPKCGCCYDTGAGICEKEGAKLISVRFPRLLDKRYRFDKRLGEGGMGIVYQAFDTQLRRQVALKLIQSDLIASERAARRFEQEARAAASFTHPNVVTVHDFGVADGWRAYLVMELMCGLTLRQELSKVGRLPARRASEILSGVCTAVDAAHRRRLLHRDLKPENIFLANMEGLEIAKILDFGIAKPIAGTDTTLTAGQTGPGELVGTLRYMSPEQLRGENASEGWDLWALAVVAYEMLTGSHPFGGSTTLDVYNAVLAGRATPLHTYLPEAPSTWQDFFDKSLSIRSELRPASALQLFSLFKQSVP